MVTIDRHGSSLRDRIDTMSDYRARVQAAVGEFYAQRQTNPRVWQQHVDEAEYAARPKRKLKPSRWPSEAQEQRGVLQWLKAVARLDPQDYAANQEGARFGGNSRDAAIRGAVAKANGMKKGRPDIEIFAPPPKYPDARGVALEMKSRDPAAKASPEQLGWLERLSRNGWVGYVAHGSDDAIEWLKSLGYGQ